MGMLPSAYLPYRHKTQSMQRPSSKLSWLFGDQPFLNTTKIDGVFVGPRVSMVTPWSTNAVEITQNMGIKGMIRIEQFTPLQAGETIDPMVSERFENLNQNLFTVEISPEPIREIDDISAYNLAEGLSLNPDEVRYLEQLAEQTGSSSHRLGGVWFFTSQFRTLSAQNF